MCIEDEGALERGYNIAVAGIPKTIDNDGKCHKQCFYCYSNHLRNAITFLTGCFILLNTVDYIDHSFGFSSAVEAACLSIRSAKTEAVCNLPNVRVCIVNFKKRLICHTLYCL